ncbi:hypothetical protein [Marivirga sp.]|uniref:hypothetical protein n=1 Tax=Marivirga sp. TaxID=2018662 RepID=UPI002D7FD19D|nr:hypothetical protein [Marivirga sp.]HET8859803.1 hypothetical protein [Marivirga sp.]
MAVLLIRLPYLIGSEPLIYETNWLLIGEALNSGKDLYKDLVSPIAPLAGWIYMVIEFIFGKSILVLHILSLLLVTYQFSLFNNIMLRNKAYNENSYIPALIYALMMFTFYDFFTFSPALISLTFILLVLDNIYLRIENKLQDATILKTGIYMGLAVLFYLPSIFFLIATLLSFALLTSLVLRRYLLFIYGFSFPIIGTLIYFYWKDGLTSLYSQWINFNIFHSIDPILDFQSIFIIAIFPTIIFVFALYKTFSASRFTNYQVRVQQVMFIMFLAACGSWWFSEQQAPFELLVFIPSFSFFIIHFVFQIKRRIRAEIFSIGFSIIIISITYTIFYQNSPICSYGDFNKLKKQESIYEKVINGKSTMILGGQTSNYAGAEKIATRYYHPQLSQVLLEEMTEKERLIALFDDIQKNEPEVILDFTGFFQKNHQELNFTKVSYQQKSTNFYVRNTNKDKIK